MTPNRRKRPYMIIDPRAGHGAGIGGFKDVDTSTESFLEFEKWWGAFHFTNDEEIRWIIEQLFVGNRLSRGTAQLEPGLPVDLKAIKAPIIVFASRGDNIPPPQQALNWIADTFVDEREIRIRGQRIIYRVHEKVGHLGIFVSSSIAKKEHTQVTSTLKAIEALEGALAQGISQSLDLWRDLRDTGFESAFLILYGLPVLRNFAERSAKGRSMGKSAELRNLPEVQRILGGIERGDIAAAVIRMLILLADSRGGVRKDRLERSAKLLHDTQPFAAMGSDRRSALIHEQSILVEFERERAMQSLPRLLAKPEDRRQAMDWIHFVVGERSDMAPHSLELIAELEKLLGVPFSNEQNASSKRRTQSVV